jgi:two-component system response regulator HydG
VAERAMRRNVCARTRTRFLLRRGALIEMTRYGARILIVDDDEKTSGALSEALRLRGHRPRQASRAAEAMEILDQEDFDVVAGDLELPEVNGLQLCERVVANHPDIPFIVTTALGSLDAAVGAIRAGAFDFFSKPFSVESIAASLERAAERRAITRVLRRFHEEQPDSDWPTRLVGDSRVMRALFAAIDAAAKRDDPVLLIGQRGTGRKLMARAVHDRSGRSASPFSLVSCARAPADVIERRLFEETRGLMRQNGTILLDNVEELPLELQDSVAIAVGGDRPGNAPRILATTSTDLDPRIGSGALSPALVDRFAARLDIPPLSAREYDVLLLANQFTRRFAAVMNKKIAGISLSAAERLITYAWPGNVRELADALERAVAHARSDQIVVDDLPDTIRTYANARLEPGDREPGATWTLDEVEQRHIMRVLAAVHGNKRRAARVLGLDVKTLRRKLESYGIRGDVRAPGLDSNGSSD